MAASVEPTRLVGREKEKRTLENALDRALESKGGLTLVSGEMGLGKTSLIQETRKKAEDKGFDYIEGRSMYHEEAVPFLPFLTALGEATDEEVILTSKSEKAFLHDVFLIHQSGLLVAHHTREEGDDDEDIVAGMLTAVQNFISDSFVDDEDERQKLIDEALTRLADTQTKKLEENKVGDVISGTGMFVRDAFAENALAKGLGRLEYGDTIILIEHGENVFTAGVVYGKDTPEIKNDLKKLVAEVESKYGDVLVNWGGRLSDLQGVEDMLKALTSNEYEIEGRMSEKLLGMERTRMFQHVLDILVDMSQKKPIMLFLDDLQWADAGSLHLLHYLARNIRDEKIAIYAGYRPEDATPILEDTLHGMETEGLQKELKLSNLSKDEICSLAEGLFKGLKLPDESLRAIYSETEGNPFYTLEVLKNLRDEGLFYMKEGKWYSSELTGVDIPKSITDVVERRMKRLSQEELDVLGKGSIFGLNMEFELLAQLVKMDEDELVDILDQLAGRGILFELEGDEATFRFNQAAVQQVLYNRLTKLKRTLMHKRAGEAIEELRNGKLGEYAPALTRHYKETKLHAKTAHFGEMGGDGAIETNSPEEAVELYKIAIVAMGKVERDLTKEEKLYLKLYSAAYTLGNWEESKNDALHLIEIADENKDAPDADHRRAIAQMLLAEILLYQNQLEEAMTMLEEVLQKSDDSTLKAEAHHGVGRIYQRKGELDMAMFSFEQGLQEAGKAGVLGLTAKITNDMGVVYDSMGEYDTSIQYKRKALAAMVELGDKYETGRALNNIGVTYIYMGDVDSSVDSLEQAIKVYKEMECAEGLAYSLSNAAEEYVMKGDLDTAEEYCQKAMPLLHRTGDKIMTANTHMVMGMIQHKREAWDLSEFQFHTALDMAKDLDIPQLLGIVYMAYGKMLLGQGKTSQGKEIFKCALSIWEELGNAHQAAEAEAELAKLS